MKGEDHLGKPVCILYSNGFRLLTLLALFDMLDELKLHLTLTEKSDDAAGDDYPMYPADG